MEGGVKGLIVDYEITQLRAHLGQRSRKLFALLQQFRHLRHELHHGKAYLIQAISLVKMGNYLVFKGESVFFCSFFINFVGCLDFGGLQLPVDCPSCCSPRQLSRYYKFLTAMNVRRLILACVMILSLHFSFGALAARKSSADEKKIVVVLDPGHGGKDYGASENGANEKDINLAVAQKLQSLISRRLKDVKVVMTRNTDTYLTLQQRADVANNAGGDLFMSIHVNSVDKKSKNRKSARGSSVYVLGLHRDSDNMKVAMRENSVIELESGYQEKYSGFDPNKDESYIIFEMAQKRNLGESIRVASDAQNALVEEAGRGNRGVRQAGFWVLWATSMPAVLVELDFICNPESVEFMTSDEGVGQLANSLFNSIQKFVERRS